MKENNYYIIVNPYFIKFYKKNKYILDYNLVKLNIKNTPNNGKVNIMGGSIDNDLKIKLENNIYYEKYLISDFVHDFFDKSRSYLTDNSINKINHYVNLYSESENKFFKNVYNDIIKNKKLNNNFILCNEYNIGAHFYKLLNNIYNKGDYYIIQDAGGLSFFNMPKEKLNEIKSYFGSNIIKSINFIQIYHNYNIFYKDHRQYNHFYNKFLNIIFYFYNKLYLILLFYNLYYIDVGCWYYF